MDEKNKAEGWVISMAIVESAASECSYLIKYDIIITMQLQSQMKEVNVLMMK